MIKYSRLVDAPVELLEPGRRVKTAGASLAVQSVLDRIPPSREFTYALVVAMGYSEFYGPNSNADWYGHNEHLDFNGLLHAWAGIGDDIEADRAKAKSWAYGYPTFYNATVFAHHKNQDPSLGFGSVHYVFANDAMKRIELVMRINNEEIKRKGYGGMLQRLLNGERTDVSMGQKIPFDLAECCTDWDAVRKAWATYDPRIHVHPGAAVLAWHRKSPIRGLAITRADYCHCFRANRNKVDPKTGKKYFVWNDIGKLFDISLVGVGADRTARAMWYMGSAETAPRISRADFYSLGLNKTAEMTKETPGLVAAVLQDADTAPDIGFGQVHTAVPDEVKAFLSTAASLGVIATPHEFQGLVAAQSPPSMRIRLRMGPCFDPTQGGVDDSFAVQTGSVLQDLLESLRAVAPLRSAWAPHINPRLLRGHKTAGAARAPATGRDLHHQKLAAAYNGYRLSVMEHAKDLAEAGHRHGDQKTAGADLAALLLGAAPLVHLLASHLRGARDQGAELGTMSQFLADHPTFVSLAALGAALRATMIAKGTGILAGAAEILNAVK